MLPPNYQRSDVLNNQYPQNEDSFHSQMFSKPSPRVKLLRRLYAALIVQWVVVGIFVLIAFFEDKFRKVLKDNYAISLVAGIVALICSFFALSFREIASKKGINIFLYFIFTVSLGLALAYISVYWHNYVLLGLYFHILIPFIFLFFYTNLIDHTLTFQGASFSIISSNLLAFELNILFTQNNLTELIILGLAGTLWAFYVVYITQTIMGSAFKHPVQDFFSLSVSIYTEIVYLIVEVCDLLRQLIVN